MMQIRLSYCPDSHFPSHATIFNVEFGIERIHISVQEDKGSELEERALDVMRSFKEMLVHDGFIVETTTREFEGNQRIDRLAILCK